MFIFNLESLNDMDSINDEPPVFPRKSKAKINSEVYVVSIGMRFFRMEEIRGKKSHIQIEIRQRIS